MKRLFDLIIALMCPGVQFKYCKQKIEGIIYEAFKEILRMTLKIRM